MAMKLNVYHSYSPTHTNTYTHTQIERLNDIKEHQISMCFHSFQIEPFALSLCRDIKESTANSRRGNNRQLFIQQQKTELVTS